jgi:Methyltransferase domain
VGNPYNFLGPFRRFFRKRRFKRFLERFGRCRTIVDIGGDHNLWTIIGRKNGVIVLNLQAPPERDEIPYVLGDGCQLPFGDQSIDLAFSNSAIEHVGSFENQARFAAEMLRVGRELYCQTPCRLFPIDPHLSAFFLHWLPRSFLKPFVLRYFTFNGWLLDRSYEYDVTWLPKRALRRIFPGCTIKTERFLGLPKSFIVTR